MKDLQVTKTSIAQASYVYTLGAAGNRTGVTELSGRSVTYGYDDLYRLTSETIACTTGTSCAPQLGGITYSYDKVGNRTAMTSTVPNLTAAGLLNYDANDRLTSDASETYDSAGNTASIGGVTNTYDFENRLVRRGNVTIVYDGDGNRAAKSAGTSTTKFLVDTNNLTGYSQVFEELVGGTVQRTYTYGLDLISQSQASGVTFYGYDGHGSVRQLSDATGTITDTYAYDGFGNLLERTGTTSNLYLYAGEQFDPELGLYFNRARYLDVRSGRFWGMDTFAGVLEHPVTQHRFLYGDANPANRWDPNGQFSIGEVSIASSIGSTLNNLSGLQGQAVMEALQDGGESSLEGIIFGAVATGVVAVGGVLVKKALDRISKEARLQLLKNVRAATQSADEALRLEGQIARRYKNILEGFKKSIRGNDGQMLTDYDVELSNAVIEVTTGIGSKKVGQITEKLLPNVTKPLVVYGPEITNKARIEHIRSTGAIFVQTLEELDQVIKALHP